MGSRSLPNYILLSRGLERKFFWHYSYMPPPGCGARDVDGSSRAKEKDGPAASSKSRST